ncbi:uncharacterized protein TEOVI_000433300 [Trypanosoma equiperdum]|uniref:Uncharacterized protein n=1 Tax=Trypanosoma equiperdum TaxID=5694 RepID=A0A1G4IK96_TRYEQ|nr:hypothetical protein, conserved [Trypanosoma equiperdum]
MTDVNRYLQSDVATALNRLASAMARDLDADKQQAAAAFAVGRNTSPEAFMRVGEEVPLPPRVAELRRSQGRLSCGLPFQ